MPMQDHRDHRDHRDGEPAPPTLPPAPGRLVGRALFQQHLRSALEQAALHGWSEMVWSDPDFADWPLGESASIELLQRWVRQGRRLTLLAHHYEALQRLHPRFVRWRGTWDHKITARRCLCPDPNDAPSALWSAAWVLHRLDVPHCVSVIHTPQTQAPRCRQVKEMLDEWVLRRSAPAFPATTLGL